VTDDPSAFSSEPEPDEPDDTAGTGIDTTVPHSARIWNYWLGGTDNYDVDRAAGDQYREIFPGIAAVARTSRGFLTRAVRYLAGEAGLRQFLDIGAGLPTADNTHEVAQRVAQGSRIVYVDNDPLVLAHARTLLTSTPEGACDYLDADLREPAAILDAVADLLDFTRPIALMLMGVMGHFTDGEAYPIVSCLLDGLPSGSYFALYDGANVNEAFNEDASAERPRHDRYGKAAMPGGCSHEHRHEERDHEILFEGPSAVLFDELRRLGCRDLGGLHLQRGLFPAQERGFANRCATTSVLPEPAPDR
jgi:hypothetical protein